LDFSYLNILLEGSALGLSLAFLFGFGPAFFALVQTGIYRGFWPAAFLATGIMLNDATIISLAVLGATGLMGGLESYHVVGIVGGALLIVFGLVTFRRSAGFESKTNRINQEHPAYYVFVLKGFLLNLVNPFVWIFWLGIVVGVTARFSANAVNVYVFFGGTLSVVYLTDLLKAYLAAKLKKYISDKFLIIINKIAGVALIIFGLFLIIKSWIYM
jgi:threonine/homoserine/homoserine lactone efflux protein